MSSASALSLAQAAGEGLRDEGIAGGIQVNAVRGQYTRGFVLRVVLLQVLNKSLAQIANRHLYLLRDLAAEVGVLIQFLVEWIRAVTLFADDAGRTEQHAAASLLALANDFAQPG